MSVGEFKAKFSAVMDAVEKGEEIIVEKGKSRKQIGVFVPMNRFADQKRTVGILQGKASFKMAEDFKMTPEELLGGEK